MMIKSLVGKVSARAAILLASGLLATVPAAAQAPTTLSYQGRLLENTVAQGPTSGSVDIVFSIWSGPGSDAGAVQLWTETWNGVALSNGIFSVLLGSNGTPLTADLFQGDTSLFLQLEIDGETLSPRQQLGSVPFAMVDEPENEFQDLSLAGNTLSLSSSTPTVDLSSYLDNTDEQTLTLDGNTLTISGSDSSVDLATYVDTDEQDLSLSGNTLSLTNDPTTVSLASYLDNTDEQDLSLSGNTLSLTNDPTAVSLAAYLDNTDNQQLSVSGNNLLLTSDDGTDSVSLASYLDNTDNQNLGLSGNNLTISGGTGVSLSSFVNTDGQNLSVSGNNLSISGGNTVSLAAFKDNTDNQDINSVLANGTDANNRDLTNLDDVDIDKLTVDADFECDASTADCIRTEHIEQDTIGGNDVTDRIFILHIECNGSCANMSMRDACNVIENLRGIDFEVELIDVSCVHGVPSTTGNQFVPCDDGTEVFSDYECRAFELRTLGDIPCVNGDGTDALVTCWATDIAK